MGASAQVSPILPLVDGNDQFVIEPIAVLDRRLVKKHNVALVEVLVRWSNTLPTKATWKSWSDLHATFPAFNP